MVKPKWIKDFKLRGKQDIRDGCDVQVFLASDLKKEIDILTKNHKEKGHPDAIKSQWCNYCYGLLRLKKRLGIDG